MKKDQADEFERELLQPLAQVLRTRLGDAGEVHVNNEPRLMTGERVEYATWLEVVLNDARTEVIFRPLGREDFSATWQWGKSGRFIFPISQGGANAGDSARASIDAVPERICQTASIWHEEPPSRLAGPRASRERFEPADAAWEPSPQRGSGHSCQRAKQPPNRCGLMQYDGFNWQPCIFEFVLFVPTRLRQGSRPRRVDLFLPDRGLVACDCAAVQSKGCSARISADRAFTQLVHERERQERSRRLGCEFPGKP